MGIPILSAFPELGAAPAANASGSRNGQGDAFASLLAVSQPKAATGDGKQSDASDASSPTATAGDQLQSLLSALAGGKVDLKAPGLGLTADQQEQLAAKLEKLLKSGDGATLLASLLAASQVNLTAADLLALTKLLGTSAQGTISEDALQGNLHLLTQAIQVMAHSGGKMTLLDAVRSLTSPGDVFAQQLGTAIDAIPIDTGPPRAPDSGDDPRDGPERGSSETSATAGSNGHEMTVSQQETSPADGAAEEAWNDPEQPSVQVLAEVLEALIKAQGQAKPETSASAQPGHAPDPKSAVVASTQIATTAIPEATAQAEAAAAKAAQSAAVQQTHSAAAQQAQSAAVHAAAQSAAAKTAAAQTDESPSQQPATAAKTAAANATDAAFDAQLATAVATAKGGDQGAAGQTGSGGQSAADKDTGKQQPVLQTTGATEQAELGTPSLTLTATDTLRLEPQAQVPVQATNIEQAIVDQIVQRAAIALTNGVQEFQITLKPEFLGGLDVRVSVDNGVAVVRLSAESAATRQLIDANIGQLKQAFGTGDVRVEHVPHFASSDQAWSFGDGNGQQTFWQGQNPFHGSSRLPDAIPFNGEPEPESESVTAATQNSGLSTQNSDSTVTPNSGGIDLKA